MNVGLLHPGQMGSSVGDALVASGHTVGWCAQGRSPASRARAAAFADFESLTELCNWAEVMLCICPPESAVPQAEEVRQTGFTGTYVDCNAVAPATARTIAQMFAADYVDGGLIGPPARQEGSTRLYLSGVGAGNVAGLFTAGYLQAVVVDGQVDSASALKMAYAAYTKGSSALLLAVNALARSAGVEQQLMQEWELSQPGLAQRSERTAAGVAPKAWRFAGEMAEIASTFADHNLPDGFHHGAQELYAALAELKDAEAVALEEVLQRLVPGR